MSPCFELIQDLYVTNTWFKFEIKFQVHDSKVIAFTKNLTEHDYRGYRTKNNIV